MNMWVNVGILFCAMGNVITQSCFGMQRVYHQDARIPYVGGYEAQRKEKASYALEHFLGGNTYAGGWVDVCCSGGGYRAMVAMAGFVQGLHDIGLWNGITNVACLSGSTWMYGPFMAKRTSIEMFIEELRKNITTTSFFDKLIPTISRISQSIEYKYAQTRDIQFVDLFGGLLADRLMKELGKMAQSISFSDFATDEYVKNYPQPLFTAVYPESIQRCLCFFGTQHHIIEITPEITRRCFTEEFISTNKLGIYHEALPCIEGLSFAHQPTLSLGSILGFCGSAYAANMEEIVSVVVDLLVEYLESKSRADLTIERGLIIRELLASLKARRIVPGRVPNFTSTETKEICLVDAGVMANLPLLPLLERQSPVILVCDASDGKGTRNGDYPQLEKIAEYAQEHNMPFPSLSSKHAEYVGNNIIIFKRNKQGAVAHDVPTIIYFYNKIDKGTFEFLYTEEEFDTIVEQMRQAVITSADIIRDEIQEKNIILG